MEMCVLCMLMLMCRCLGVRCLNMFNVWRCSNCGDVCSMYVDVNVYV